MSRRSQKKLTTRPHESINPDKCFVRIYDSMMQSAAWKSLNANQCMLYICMKHSRYKATDSERRIINSMECAEDLFFFNRARWYTRATELKTGYCFRLYSNQKQFYRDRDKLIEVGLIETVEYRAPADNIHPKNLYKLSTKWKYYVPPEV